MTSNGIAITPSHSYNAGKVTWGGLGGWGNNAGKWVSRIASDGIAMAVHSGLGCGGVTEKMCTLHAGVVLWVCL